MANAKKTSLIRPERHLERFCGVCGKVFRPRRNQKFCSSKCRRASWSAANPLGLTLRQYYAGIALQATILAKTTHHANYEALAVCSSERGLSPERGIAQIAFDYADAMIQHERDSK